MLDCRVSQEVRTLEVEEFRGSRGEELEGLLGGAGDLVSSLEVDL